ncbi:hypothetical protein LTR36_009664 [Oleoguttula mirabilis]|uniref:ArfGap-domain-containing protein n=1 Tax=Oleoguttula mirabilis TaxID=1507867 RepID=A0AAV9J5M9_9PEZI|nr:hypothetical protein LTR36_009664 [Oleoguttula mirabilis]
MASVVSKRMQARNERALGELRTIPGNDRCADCSAKNPGWASWNLGVFLCMRCAGLHRKLGTHVSKIKSLSMDSWTTEQVDSMKKAGNAESNKRYNPRNVRPDIPVDADEVEMALEKYIRQKYEQRAFMPGGGAAPASAPVRQNTGSTGTGSWGEEPPPLPPKPGKRFGFSLRSASAILPRHSKQDRNFTPPLSPAFSGSDRSGPEATSPREVKESKPSRMFGMKITSVSNNFDAKLATLRDMGFSDNRRNSDVLKSMNGNLDQAIETLVRLGDGGSNTASRSETPGPRALTPLSMASQGFTGITIDKTRQAEAKANSNPWEIRDASPQRAATQPLPQASAVPRSQSAAPAQSSWNPFLSQPQQQAQPLENSFQNLQVSQTGPAQQQYAQQQAYGQQAVYQNNPYEQAANPWDAQNVPQMPQQQQQPIAQPSYAPQQYQQPAQAPQSDQTSNPFLRRAASQTFTPSNPWAQPAPLQQQVAPQQQNTNPYGVPWQQQQQNAFQQPTTQSPAPMYGGQAEYFAQQQQPQQMQQQPQQTQAQQQQWPVQDQMQQNYAVSSPAPNPWQQQQQQQPMMPQQTGAPHQQQYQQAPQQYQQPPQEQAWSYTPKDALPSTQPGRFDKSSILSLYSMQPQFAASRPMQTLPEDGQVLQQQQHQQYQQSQQQQQYQQAQPQQVQPRSVTMPMQQSVNPFMAQQAPMTTQGIRHVSNESAAFVGMAGDGRHSPDAFSGLSARYVR